MINTYPRSVGIGRGISQHSRRSLLATAGFFTRAARCASLFLLVLCTLAGSPLAAQSLTWSAGPAMGSARQNAAAVTLNDGKVLVTGGLNGLGTADLYNPATGTWTTINMVSQRYLHQAEKLPDGRVLVIAGAGPGRTPLNTAEIYDPATNTFTAVANMAESRDTFASTVLNNGKVLVHGGWSGSIVRSSGEIYDPATNTWTATGASTVRAQHRLVTLPNGKVLMISGHTGAVHGPPECYLYDPTTNAWTQTGSMNIGRDRPQSALLTNGKVLTIGDYTTCELYDPATGTWSYTGSMSTSRWLGNLIELGDGKLLAVGGSGLSIWPNMPASSEIYNPATGTWSAAGAAASGRIYAVAVRLQNGDVLVAGGTVGSSATAGTVSAGVEIFDGPAVVPVNVALGKPVIRVSSILNGGFPGSKVTDGSTSDSFSPVTHWITADGQGVGAFFTLDLQGVFNLTEIKLRNTNNVQFNDRGTGAFRILASNSVDGSNQLISPQTILTGTLTQGSGTLVSFTNLNGFTAGNYRYLHFMVDSLAPWASTGSAGLNEIEAYGVPYSGPLNSAPTDITLTPASIAENNAANATVGTLAAVDADLADSHAFTKVTGAGDTDNGSFTIDGTALKLTPVADFETKSSYSIRVEANDGAGGTFAKAMTVTITNVNEAPTVIGAAGKPSGLAAWWKADGNANDSSANLNHGTAQNGAGFTTGRSGQAFSLDGSNDFIQVPHSASLSFSSSFTVESWVYLTSRSTYYMLVTKTSSHLPGNYEVRISHGSGLIDFGLLSPSVGLFFASSNAAVPLNQWAHVAVVFTAGTGVQFYINGAAAGSASMTGLPLVNSDPVRIGARADGFSWLGQIDDLALYNRALNSTEIAAVSSVSPGLPTGSLSLAENAAAGTSAGTLAGLDPDAGDALTYSLVSGTGDSDNASFTIDGTQVRSTAVFDFETKPSYSVRVRATDGGGFFTEEALTIAITNVNDAPTDIALSNASIAENNAANATIGTLSATDVDSGNTHTFAFAGGADDAAFTITGATLSINSSADFETKSSYAIRIRATDSGAGNLTFEKNFTVTITDVTIPQTITFGALAGKTFGDAPFTVSATGGASGQPVTFSIASGPASISGNEVTLTGAGSVTVRASQAGASEYTAAADVDQSFTVAKVAQTITFTAPATVGDQDTVTLSATGGASGNAVTLSIVSGPGSLTGNALTFTGLGPVIVRASQAGNANYAAADDVEATITVVLNEPPVAVDDAVTITTGDATVYPLANDSDAESQTLTIAAVSEPSVQIDGRTLVIPAGYTGTFTYTVSDGVSADTANVSVTTEASPRAPTLWSGLLYNSTGAISGRVTLSSSTGGVNVLTVRLGNVRGTARFGFPNSTNLSTSAGVAEVAQTPDGRMSVTLTGGHTASLRPTVSTTTRAQYNVAVSGVSTSIPGGGYGTVKINAIGRAYFTLVLPDGRRLVTGSEVADNGSITLFGVQAQPGTSAPGYVGGELILANLATTDVTGELEWRKAPVASGMHRTGVNAVLTVNGSVFNGAFGIPDGTASITFSGGDSPSPVTFASTVVAGKVNPVLGMLVSWKIHPVTKAFSIQFPDPATRRLTVAYGIYLPKAGKAVGFFRGANVGGKVELATP
jgi:hypothetical protein